MTTDAQNALRRTMELHSKVTRFCFCCNYISRIIEPLASRCAKFRFKPLGAGTVGDRIQHICDAEGVALDGGTLDVLLGVAGGDMRKAITTLQSAASLGAGTVGTGVVTDVAGVVPGELMEGLVRECRQPVFERMQVTVLDLVGEGYAAHQVLTQLADWLVGSPEAKDVQKAALFATLSEADHRLCDGADGTLQLLRVCSEVQAVLTAPA